MIWKIIIKQCLLALYILVSVADIAFLIYIVKDAVQQFKEDYPASASNFKPVSKFQNAKGWLYFIFFFIPLFHLIILKYLLVKTEVVYEMVYAILDERTR